MIIKSNLASKPTRNYSLYFIGCLLLFITAVAFTAYNLSSIMSSYAKSSKLRDLIAEQQRLRASVQGQAGVLRNQISAIKTPDFVSETEFLNNAIKRRVFSWTALFDQFEAIFPNNVKMTSVIPSISGEDIGIRMEITGKELKDVIELIKVLQNHPAFSDVVFKSERQENDGTLQAAISLKYRPELATEASGKKAPAPKSQTAAATQREKKEL